MRQLLLAVVVAVPLFAQDTRSAHITMQPLVPVVDRVEADVMRDVDTLRRDTFIHSELLAVADSMHDFQINVTVQRAVERVSYMSRRAAEFKQPLPSPVAGLIASVRDRLDEARNQGSTADPQELERFIRERVGLMERIVIGELGTARLQRKMVSDAEVRLNRITEAIDTATNEALLSLIQYVGY
jgi:hypothetical protein